MPNDFVNTITTSSGTTYDIHDKRVDNLSGGTQLYAHVIGPFPVSGPPVPMYLLIINTSSTPITATSTLQSDYFGIYRAAAWVGTRPAFNEVSSPIVSLLAGGTNLYISYFATSQETTLSHMSSADLTQATDVVTAFPASSFISPKLLNNWNKTPPELVLDEPWHHNVTIDVITTVETKCGKYEATCKKLL